MEKLTEKCEKSELGVKRLTLTTTFRCASNIVKLINTIVPDVKAASWAKEGRVENISQSKLVDLVSENDMILCRRNAPLVSLAFKLIKAGKTVRVRGRDIGGNIKNLIKKLKAKSIPNLIEKAENHRFKESVRIKKKTEYFENQLLVLNDKIDTLVALCDGVRGLQELENKINELFSDARLENCITLSSVHKAKGLEAHTVFIIEYSRIELPLRRVEDRANERFVHYVGISRPKENLYLVD